MFIHWHIVEYIYTHTQHTHTHIYIYILIILEDRELTDRDKSGYCLKFMQMMSGQPTTEQIVRRFVWCQWDAVTQRLYYIHNKRLNNSHGPDSMGHKLSTIQFHSGNKFDNMVCECFAAFLLASALSFFFLLFLQ